MGPTPDGDGIRFLTVKGAAIADLVASNGQVRVTAADNDVTPNLTPAEIICFIGCLGGSDAGCAFACAGCLGANPFSCAQCLVCAGPRGISCARLCFG
jgi:hypothetical protein